MKAGEKYLYVKIVGHEGIAVFPNLTKTKPNQPDFKADGIGVWVKIKRERKAIEEQKVEEVFPIQKI